MNTRAIIAIVAVIASSAANAKVLWDQSTGQDGGTIRSQEYPDFPSFSVYASDDFTPNWTTWSVQKVTVYGTETGLSSANISVNLHIGFSPDINQSRLIATGTQVGNNLVFGDGRSTLFTVSGGKKWLFAYVKRSFGAGGSWNLNTRPLVRGLEAFVHNPGGGFGLGTDPFPISTLTGAPADLAFKIEGMSSGPGFGG